MSKPIKDQTIRELMPELVSSLEHDDKATGLSILSELATRFLDNQARQTLALERIAEDLEAQTKAFLKTTGAK